jgi:patatin-like phospholipase/acyl hydrolase
VAISGPQERSWHMADPVEKEKPFRILSLAGGGYLGLYTACVLTELEAQVGEPLGRRFDLIAGTSVGGILAIALAYEMPMAQVQDLFLEHGTAIFSDRGLPTSAVGKLRDLTRSVLGPKYDGKVLRKALLSHLGRITLDDALHHIVIPCTNVSLSQTKIFKTPHAQGSRGDESAHALNVAMATSAAPAYFPAVQIGKHLYADGGMFAVAPDQVALHEAEHFLGVDASRIRMLSIGTGIADYRPSSRVAANDGAINWLSEGRLILTLIAVQQQHVQAMVEDRLGDRYMHIDGEWPRHAELGIDIATPKAVATLTGLAADTLGRLDMAKLKRSFLSRRQT